jgi:hypothetical protein
MAEQVAVAGLVPRVEGEPDAVVADGSRAAADGWTVRYELVVVDGDVAEQLMSRQAAAVRGAGVLRPVRDEPAAAGWTRRQRDRSGMTFFDLKLTAYRLVSACSGCSVRPWRRTPFDLGV